jgi:hypothetical protein
VDNVVWETALREGTIAWWITEAGEMTGEPVSVTVYLSDGKDEGE